ncbi:hypothetical protein ACFQ77_08745 [Streptomyces virginiae]|uniref:hypothetical protein n=1 Tax=Streptomyces virginiae TaxID=1961 RepID=UPI0036A3B212
MSTTARLLATVFAASVLSGVAPLASAATPATDPKGIGWDVVPAHATVSVSAAGASDNGIGWD